MKARWQRLLWPPEKPWQGVGDLEWGYLFWVIVWFAIWVNSYAGIYR